MKKYLALMLCLCMLLSGCAGGAVSEAPQKPVEITQPPANTVQTEPTTEAAASETVDVWDTIREAYIYALPLVLMDASKAVATNTEEVITGKSPVNQFIHNKALATASYRDVVSPNVDTIYTQVWYDLSEEPIIYVLPEAGRFCKVQVLDAWTNTPAVLDQAGTYAITLSSWEGELPDGVTRVDVPTALAWSITRTVLSGEDDLPNVRAIQAEMQLLPLSAYLAGGEYEAPKGSYSADNDFVPINKVLSMDPVTFFSKANELMKVNPPAAADAEIMERIARVGVGPGMTFDVSILTGDVKVTWTQMLQNIRPTLMPQLVQFTSKIGQWTYFGAPIGNFGTAYAYRALVAIAGLGANPVEVALYPKLEVDADGNALTGEKSYTLHFETCPQVLEGGFWSITAYGDDDFLIDNPIDRYCINDRSGLKVNEDGSIDVILSKDAPEDTTNWLPVGADGFHLYMRIYTPDMDALETWTAPVINVID